MPALLICVALRAASADEPVSAAAPTEPPPAGASVQDATPSRRQSEPIVIDQKLSMEVLIERGSRAFVDARYDTALAYLTAAYARKPLAPILFNIAQAQRKAGYSREALATYQRFLEENPRSALSPEAAAHAAAMQAKLEAEQATVEKAAAEQRSRERTAAAEQLAQDREAERLQAEAALRKEIARKEKPVYKRKWFWGVLAGLVGAGVVTGVALGIALRTPPEPVGDLSTQVVKF